MHKRPRRNRRTTALRELVRETRLSPSDFVLPLFAEDTVDGEVPIASMPGVFRYGLRGLVERAALAHRSKIQAVALFPSVPERAKDPEAREALNPDGLIPRAVRAIKDRCPELLVITDIALDPYSSDGHDGLLVNGRIDNDLTLPRLAEMAVVSAAAGADIVAPSDMMDGRVQAIREALDRASYTEVALLSYAVKYASAFYGPFRDALDSAPRSGDKRTYQMDPGNALEALREARLDEEEGADILLVKPALSALDVIRRVADTTTLPVAAYHVSGEYAMLCAAARAGWLDYDACLLETMLAIRRAGARIIFTYAALDVVRLLGA